MMTGNECGGDGGGGGGGGDDEVWEASDDDSRAIAGQRAARAQKFSTGILLIIRSTQSCFVNFGYQFHRTEYSAIFDPFAPPSPLR